jgi:D-alanyl-lipoteichoic acid acyltransferase DltB (MBOAT superfamily)
MLFHTWPFFVFALVVLPVYYALRGTRLWIPWLLAASYFFYGYWKPIYLVLVVYSTALDYLLVTLMEHCPRRKPEGAQPSTSSDENPRRSDSVLRASLALFTSLTIGLSAAAFAGPARWQPTCIAFAVLVFLMAVGSLLKSRRIWLFISLFNNLALLLFFKYAGFVGENFNEVFSRLHIAAAFPKPDTLMPPGWTYVLPVGISFFTFQSMSYTIDFYLGKVARERNFLRFATFVCFFPQLMAGPIERARQMLPQLQQAPAFRMENLTDGMSLFLVGLFKKAVLANYLALYVDRIYNDDVSRYGALPLMLATFAFAWQIFFDFSGYTDMARGLAKMMGFNLVLNFNNPYMATGLGEFWARWHISLSTWFRDYVYIPLGGSRRGNFALYRNLFITFLISGIWHGSAWRYAIWGGLHAIGVILTRELERSAFYRDRIPVLVKRAGVFLYVSFAWIFFRANSLADARTITERIFTAAGTNPVIPALMLALVCAVVLYQVLYESRLRAVLKFSPVRVVLAVAMILCLGLLSTGGQAFIYFQF